MEKLTCCYLNKTLQAIYQEQIQDEWSQRRQGYHKLGYSATFYHLFKNLEKEGFLCGKCVDFSEELAEIYLKFRQKYQNIHQ